MTPLPVTSLIIDRVSLNTVFEKRIEAAKFLELSGHSRTEHAARITRYTLETLHAELLAIGA